MDQMLRAMPLKARNDTDTLLRIEDLRVVFHTYHGVVQALSGINLGIYKGKVTGLVGETGCGKSVMAKSIARLIPKPGEIVSGRILLDGEDLLQKTEDEMRDIRGKEIAMIFQNPRTALNPVFTLEDQMHFFLERHQGLDRAKSRRRIVELLGEVSIADPQLRLKNYPFELSTGMCQRVMIAMAVSCQPKLLIADEPTTGLDVTIQAQILDLFSQLVYQTGATALLITHDLGVVAETCDYTGVMYAGKMVEFGPTESIFQNPLHPYTRGLIDSCFTPEQDHRLNYIPGTVPDLLNLPSGCLFAPRCEAEMDVCETEDPPIATLNGTHWAQCFALKADD